MEERFKRILVTRGAGFIGSHFVEAALQNGLRAKALDNLSSGRLDNLSSCLAYRILIDPSIVRLF